VSAARPAEQARSRNAATRMVRAGRFIEKPPGVERVAEKLSQLSRRAEGSVPFWEEAVYTPVNSWGLEAIEGKRVAEMVIGGSGAESGRCREDWDWLRME